MISAIHKFLNLPDVSVSDKNATEKFGHSGFSIVMIDILDGDFWSSKASVLGNLVLVLGISLSSIAYIWTNGEISVHHPGILGVIEIITGLLFSIEFLLRIRYARYHGFNSGKFPGLNYCLSFPGLIDLLTIIPFLATIPGIELAGVFSVVRILRLWRIARYVPAFRSITEAFKSRQEEIMITLIAVILLSLTLSAIMFHAEKSTGVMTFASILEVFIWSLGKYTGDYGSIAEMVPVSTAGKWIATVNGLLGIALFAIPAGLLASAFIDQLAENKKSREIRERFEKLQNFFTRSKGSRHFRFNSQLRHATFETLQVKFVYSDSDLFEAIRASWNLRLRAMKSSPEMKYNDTRIVEFYRRNRDYGFKQSTNSKIFLVNPVGFVERGISHFSYGVQSALGANLVSREFPIYFKDIKSGTNRSVHYPEYLKNGPSGFDSGFIQFAEDVSMAGRGNLVIILSSGASGRSDVILEYGNQKGVTGWIPETTSFDDESRFLSVLETIRTSLNTVYFRAESEKDMTCSYSTEESSLGLSADSLLYFIRKKTGADVISLHINISHLIADNDSYYCMLSGICEALIKISEQYNHSLSSQNDSGTINSLKESME